MKKNFKILSNFLIICFFIFSCGEKKVDNNNLKEKQKNFFEIKKLNLEKKQLEKELINLESEREGYKILAAQENTTEKGGCGPKCQKFEKMANQFIPKIDSLKNKISSIENKIDGFKSPTTLKMERNSELKTEKSLLTETIKSLEKERDSYISLAENQMTNENGGCGPKCQKFKMMANEVSNRINETKNNLKVVDEKLKK